MSAVAPSTTLSAAEFLAWEGTQADKHEWCEGEVFAMAGGSLRHAALASALAGELHVALRGGPCRVLSSDQKIVARAGRHYVYPDASVLCGVPVLEPGTSDVLANPSAILEVLSSGTESYDRGLKWRSYQEIESLQDYVMVSQTSVRLEHYQRAEDGGWRFRTLGPGERLVLSNGTVVHVDAVYMGVFELDGDAIASDAGMAG